MIPPKSIEKLISISEKNYEKYINDTVNSMVSKRKNLKYDVYLKVARLILDQIIGTEDIRVKNINGETWEPQTKLAKILGISKGAYRVREHHFLNETWKDGWFDRYNVTPCKATKNLLRRRLTLSPQHKEIIKGYSGIIDFREQKALKFLDPLKIALDMKSK